ncbi:hypothetical protein H8693_01030 [Christensenellaceae bacterium NSJ-63]|uniref:Uncharacterized protein n=1 Tax=Guopingia tenuis TaxID=2763656 RepID=A0A926DGS4_9FIRM|nr:hypothetical protein [Guopingia tenuis]MBC8537517.1 hypothetical protein [Guopingia tenuis]
MLISNSLLHDTANDDIVSMVFDAGIGGRRKMPEKAGREMLFLPPIKIF